MSVSSTTSWTSRNVTVASDQIVAKWLFSVALLVALMVVIGGVTRLTGSGLSMGEWRPLIGALPPMTTLEWQRVYQLYQASPEYQQFNYGMSLSEFKTIFFWEYFHRLWGRLLGLVFGLPLITLALTGHIPSGFGRRLFLLLILGGFQESLAGGWSNPV